MVLWSGRGATQLGFYTLYYINRLDKVAVHTNIYNYEREYDFIEN